MCISGRAIALVVQVCTYHFSKLRVWFCSVAETEILECHDVSSETQLLCFGYDIPGSVLVGIILYYNCTNNQSFFKKRKIVYLSEEKKPEI